MYNSQEIAERIKLRAKQQGKPLAVVLAECGLGKNTVSKISNGTDILTLNFAKIADSLDCSIDFLLNREKQKEKPIPGSEDGLSEAEQSMLMLFRLVPVKDQGMVTQMIEAALRSRGLL